MRMLIVDNFDSFTYNLAQLFAAEDVDVVVRRNTAAMDELLEIEPDALCISPGPGTPRESGVSLAAVRHWQDSIPVLGVCLGMQVINELYGGRTVHALSPVHGKAHAVRHDDSGLFTGVPTPFLAARYHSLAIERRSEELVENAWADDGTVMALRHRVLRVHAVQFHPESFLTEHGAVMARNFLSLCRKGDA